MTTNTADLLLRKSGHSLIKIDDNLAMYNYVVVNENTKDYYYVSIAKNTTIKESVESEIYYTIKKNNDTVIKEDIYEVFPLAIVNRLKSTINEVEEYVDGSNSDEVVDYLVDIFDELGYRPRHVIHYDDVVDGLEYDFLMIIAGSLESLYVKVENNGDVYIIDEEGDSHLMGNTEDPAIITKSFERHFDSLEHFSSMMNEDLIEEAIKESFNQIYGVVVENGNSKIYDKKTLKECGFVDRKNGIYKLNEELSLYGKDSVKVITEEYEVNTLLTEEVDDTIMGSKQFEIFKKLFLDKVISFDAETFDGDVIITNPEFKMMTWIGSPHPTVTFDVNFVNINKMRNLIPGEDTTVFDFNENPELKMILHSLMKMAKEDLPVLYPLRNSMENEIRKKFKYFGLEDLNPKVNKMSLSSSPVTQ